LTCCSPEKILAGDEAAVDLFGLEKREDISMSEKLRKLIEEARSLDVEERAELEGTLLLSQDEPSDSDVARLWIGEAERRLQGFREGKVDR